MEQRNNGYMVCYGSGELQSAVLQYIIMLEKTKMALAEPLPYALTLTDFLDRLWHYYITLADVKQLGISYFYMFSKQKLS